MMKKILGLLASGYLLTVVIGGISGGVGVNGIGLLACDVLLLLYILWRTFKK